jgi:hypothetical protein
MNVIARCALALATVVILPGAATGQSVVKVPMAAPSDIEKYLPPLPADVPWLTTRARTQPSAVTSTLPEAFSFDALLWMPEPADEWAPPLKSPSATETTAFGG